MKQPSQFWIVAMSVALFAPIMGRGLIHDDYLLLSSAARNSVWSGLTHADIFYTPLTWLTFKFDWVFWHANPLAMASFNLALHLLNILLIYQVSLKLFHSERAAWWAAFGFALLFPANSWAIMWIATRAHVLVTTFCLAAMLAAIRFVETNRSRFLPGLAMVVCAALAILSKENGITVPAIVGLILLRDRIAQGQSRVPLASIVRLFVAFSGVIIGYGLLRSHSGAVAIHSGDGTGYSYAFSMKVLIDNSLRYAWRTFGLLALLAGAVALAEVIRGYGEGRRPSLRGLTGLDVMFSIAVFAVMISPVVLLSTRSGIYTYLPGIAAVLLLGVTVKVLQESDKTFSLPAVSLKTTLASVIPIFIVALVYVEFSRGYSQKWKQMAETDASVMGQIAAQQGTVAPGSLIVLTYDTADAAHRFPDGFASWGFAYAMKVLYRDPSMDGRIVLRGADSTEGSQPAIHFAYRLNELNRPQVVRESETAP